MYGLGILQGLWTVFLHFIDSYLDDVRWLGRRYYNPEALAVRQGSKAQGIFTVQYPEEKLASPEEFRYIPFLLYEVKADGKPEGKPGVAATGVKAEEVYFLNGSQFRFK